MDEPALLHSTNRRHRPRAVDDAGSPIRAIDLHDLPVAQGDTGRAMRRFVKQLKAAARHEGSSSKRGQVLLTGLGIAVFVGWGLLQSRFPMTLASMFGVLGVLMVASWVITRRLGLTVQRGGIARTIVARGFCGGCGYDLRDADRHGVRFVECPECGARWSPGLVLAAPIGSASWEQLGTGGGRVSESIPLATDDRGVLVRRIRSTPWRAPRAAQRSWTREQQKAMRRVRRRCGLRTRLIASGLSVSMLGVLGWLLFSALNDTFGAVPGAMVIAAFVLVCLTPAIWTGEMGVASGTYVKLVRDAGICGACGTPIDDAPIDGDGLRVCTMCGSGWKNRASAGFDE